MFLGGIFEKKRNFASGKCVLSELDGLSMIIHVDLCVKDCEDYELYQE